MNYSDYTKILKIIDTEYPFDEDMKKKWSIRKSEMLQKELSVEKVEVLIQELEDPHTFLIEPKRERDFYNIEIIWSGENLFLINTSPYADTSKIIEVFDMKIETFIKKYFEKYNFMPRTMVKLKIIEDLKYGKSFIIKDQIELVLKTDDLVEHKYLKMHLEQLYNIQEIKKIYSEFKPVVCQDINSEARMIRILTFNHPNVDDLVIEELEINKDRKNIIFDLRYNCGGLVEKAKAIIGNLVEEDVLLGYLIRDRSGNEYKQVIKSKGNILKNSRIIVLINEFTMSSAEYIFALGIRLGFKNSIIIGEKSAGIKDQAKIYQINSTIQLQMTIKKYIGLDDDLKLGIKPDIYIQNLDSAPFCIHDHYLDAVYKILNS